VALFGRRLQSTPAPPAAATPTSDGASTEDAGGMALDALASALRAMAEFALEREGGDVDAFRRDAEAWAQHVVIAAPPPGAAPAPGLGRLRDWHGVRTFIREYLGASSRHAASVTGDLRDVIWVFVRTFGHSLAQDEEVDGRMRQQVARLEQLVSSLGAAELKREVAETMGGLTSALDERRQRQRSQMVALGDAVRSLGDELVSARREGEIDPLTRVANRKAFDRHLVETLEVHRAFGQDASLVLVDVDLFKEVNDGGGHLFGDEVLRQVADTIVKVFLRKSDFVARYGGDEFAVMLRETPGQQLPALAERMLARVRALRRADGAPLGVTVSIGGASAQPTDDARGWFARADRGLYAAKAAGRDRFAFGGVGAGAVAAPATAAGSAPVAAPSRAADVLPG